MAFAGALLALLLARPARGIEQPAKLVVSSATIQTGKAVGPGFTVIPLPAFTYNPNEGWWVGALTPIFRANQKGQVEDIFAPLYLHNQLIGETFTFNYFGYRNETQQFHAVLSHATRIERTIDLSYQDVAAGPDGRYIVSVQANDGKSAFNRFFGFGNATTPDTETTYTMGDANFRLAGGVNLNDDFAIIAAERYRTVGVENGASHTLPQTLDFFPDAPGIEGANIVGQSLTAQYDTRDNQLTPLSGTYATAFGEYNENVKFTERNHWWRTTLQARHFLPHHDDRAVFVSHFMVDSIAGQDENVEAEDAIGPGQSATTSRLVKRGVPFYERPTLGGETTLRAFGRGRFVSNFAWLVNLEERVKVLQGAIMGNQLELELAPFVDVGRVGRVSTDDLAKNVEVDPGFGIRALARPNIACRMDMAWGKDGSAVYVGLDYPF